MAGERTREGGNDGGLVVNNNETLRSFLRSAADDHDHLTPELRHLALDLCSQSSIPYRSLRTVWFALPSGDRPALRRLFAGAEFVFSSPKPREKVREP